MLMWNSQKMVFQRTCVIFFGHSISKPPFHVLGSPSFYELYGGHYLPLSGKTENASYLFLFPYSPFGSLAAGVQVHNLDSKDNCPRVTGNAHHQGCVTGRAVATERLHSSGSSDTASARAPCVPSCLLVFSSDGSSVLSPLVLAV